MANVNLTVKPPVWSTMTAEERKTWLCELEEAVRVWGHIIAWTVEGDAPAKESPGKYDWVGWEAEPETTNDGSGDPEKHFLTVRDPEGEEYALIVHRTVGGKYPLDGDLAQEKIAKAKNIVAALNAEAGPAECDEVIKYSLELGVDARGDRVCVLEIAAFETQEEAERFARASEGDPASRVKVNAESLGLCVDDMDAQEGDQDRPVTGATVCAYTDHAGTVDSTDLY